MLFQTIIIHLPDFLKSICKSLATYSYYFLFNYDQSVCKQEINVNMMKVLKNRSGGYIYIYIFTYICITFQERLDKEEVSGFIKQRKYYYYNFKNINFHKFTKKKICGNQTRHTKDVKNDTCQPCPVVDKKEERRANALA